MVQAVAFDPFQATQLSTRMLACLLISSSVAEGLMRGSMLMRGAGHVHNFLCQILLEPEANFRAVSHTLAVGRVVHAP